VELLGVLFVIIILAGIGISVTRVASRKAEIGRAVAELQGIATSLEEYRLAHGHVPEQLNDWWAITNYYYSTNTTVADVLAPYFPGDGDFPDMDPWDRPYVYYATNRLRYVLGSRGVDGRFGDGGRESYLFGQGDDLVYGRDF
jgi:type II secretory pathway pseudopilin PulG